MILTMLVEDHPEYREVLELAIAKAPNLELAGEFGTAERALRSILDGDLPRNPDVILLDLNLPGMGGVESIPHFLSAIPGIKIIVLTQSEQEADVLAAISSGASGYLLKSSTVKKITEAIQSVMNGGASLDPNVARFVLNTLRLKMPKSDPDAPALTERELEIITLLADGLVKKEIAQRLGIGTSTVVTHVGHIYSKLQASNVASAINKAHRLGLLG
ncbi:MAG: response regulator transcription factor [Luteolibacter sp.]